MRKSRHVFLFIAIIVALILLWLWFIKGENQTQISFYYWKSNFELNYKERELLKQLKCTKMYLHLFDVDTPAENKEAIPTAQLRFTDTLPANTEIIPVIYITQKCFNEIDEANLKLLAKRIVRLSEQIVKKDRKIWNEFQIDCDWTEKNRQAYFKFLNYLKQELPAPCLLSATIRLHQIKYAERTGIPPVDKGLLMFYNMGEIKTFDVKNSIYDKGTAEKYLDHLKTYTLPLDYALPAFGWGLHYRMNKLTKIIGAVEFDSIKASNKFNIKGNLFVCKEDGYCGNNYFKKGDLIESEKVNFNLCYEAAKQLQEFSKSTNRNIIFYHLGSSEIQNYETHEFEAIGSLFN